MKQWEEYYKQLLTEQSREFEEERVPVEVEGVTVGKSKEMKQSES